jgi:hypothetical protein
MKAIYIVPTIVTAIIIGLAVSAAFAIGPIPFMGGMFTGYPSNNEGQGYTLSGAEPTPKEAHIYFRVEEDWISLTHNVLTDTYESSADTNYLLVRYEDAKTGTMQSFEAWVHVNFPDSPSTISPIPHKKCEFQTSKTVFFQTRTHDITTQNQQELNNKWGEPVPKNSTGTTRYADGTNLADQTCFLQTWCQAGDGIVASVSKFGILTPYTNLVSTILRITPAPAIYLKLQ